jgi:hypothetical protein
MKTLKGLIITLLCIVTSGAIFGQSLTGDYHAAIGLRAGETSGITFKFRTGETSRVELLAGVWSDWINLTGLYERHVPAFSVEGMRWYYGAGGHVAFATGNYYNGGRHYTRGSDFAAGVDGIAGIEYKIPPIPIALSLDIKPFMEIYRNGDLYFGVDPGLGVKFTF